MGLSTEWAQETNAKNDFSLQTETVFIESFWTVVGIFMLVLHEFETWTENVFIKQLTLVSIFNLILVVVLVVSHSLLLF